MEPRAPAATIHADDSEGGADAPWRDPIAIADVTLAMALDRDVERVELAAAGDRCFISVTRDGYAESVGVTTRAIGEATIVRLGLIAGAKEESGAEVLGRTRVALGGETGEVLVGVGTGSDGLVAELRRITGGAAPWLPRNPAPVPPTKVGPYRVLEELGRGGAGIVHRAMHESLQREAAVKLLYDQAIGRAESRARFLREARAASRIDHPGVVRVLDYGTAEDGRPYLVMEKVTGPTLRSTLDEQGPFGPLRAAWIGAEIAAALDVAHAAGVVHCDIKPENIFLMPGDRTKVVDFGAAQLNGSELRGMNIVGTPAYMAPELFSAEAASPVTDLYALGCVLFQMLTGDPPFDGPNFLELADAHRESPVPPLSDVVPPALAKVIRRCLAKDPESRPESAAWVRELLLGVLE